MNKLKTILSYMLMLLRTYRLVRLINKLVKENYKTLEVKKHGPLWLYNPTLANLEKKFRILSLSESKRKYIFNRTLKYAETNGYVKREYHGSSAAYIYFEVTPDNGERLLEGWFYWGYFKELIRVNNFLATLFIAIIAVVISVFALLKPGK